MDALNVKVPPPLVALVIGVAMWGSSRVTAPLEVGGFPIGAVAGIMALLGGAVSLAGVIAFRRAKTTVNPLKPENASALVTGGIYRITRNPMYVGLLLALLAWAVFLRSPWTLLGPILFVLYMNRFQIRPEERALRSLFGEQYAEYMKKVRRWL